MGQTEVVTYPRASLALSRDLIDEDRHSIAVVVAHMACEIATERLLSESFAAKGVQYLEEAVTQCFNGYNLNNERIRTFYTALAGDEVQKAPFWKEFKKSAKLRNDIIHGGAMAGKGDAEASYPAANELLTHLKYT
jgi:hypothetical protein